MRDDARDDLGWGDQFEDSDAASSGAESDASASEDDGRRAMAVQTTTTTTATTTTTSDAAASRIARGDDARATHATHATAARDGAYVGSIGPELAALRAAQGEIEGTLHDVALRSVVRKRATVATGHARE